VCGLHTLINKINARSLTLLIFATGWEVCGRPKPRHESMMPVLSFSLLRVLSAKTLSCVELIHTLYLFTSIYVNIDLRR